MCGENPARFSRRPSGVRSPPRVRGKRIKNELFSRGDGIPSRVRRKLCDIGKLLVTHRITPARAGKTFFRALSHVLNPNHPRACGENFFQVGLSSSLLQSPPRVRGKLPRLSAEPHDSRITPACAGKTFTCQFCWLFR